MGKIKRAMPFIITGIVIVTLLMIQFTVVSANTDIKVNELVTNILTNAGLLVIMGTTWSAAGRLSAKSEEKSSYALNKKTYAEKTVSLSERGLLKRFEDFCALKTKALLENKITALLNSVCISYENYINEYSQMPLSELTALTADKRTKKVLLKVRRGKVKVRAVKASDVMADSKSSAPDGYGLEYDEKSETRERLLVKTLQSVVSGAALAIMVIELSQNIASLSAWAFFGLKLLLIVWNAWSGFNDGYNQIAETKNKVILRRIMFINLFDEWAKVPLLNKGSDN